MKLLNRASLGVICVLSLVFGACEEPRYETDPWMSFYFLDAFLGLGRNTKIPEEYVLEDLGDGRIRFSILLAQYSAYANTPRRKYEVLLRKCAQGFLFDAGSNSCLLDPGLGGADPNLAKLQYCDQATNACNELQGQINGVGNSEMYTSCANETTGDLAWQPAGHYTLERLTRQAEFHTLFPDLAAQWIFASLAASTSDAYAFRSDVGRGAHSKTSRNFVLCEYVLPGGIPTR